MSESTLDDVWLRGRLSSPSFPRSAGYDLRWQFDLSMGPNSLWLTEFLTDAMQLRPGMRVLDLGCGRGGSSVFLAREYGVEVWATDLWIDPTDNHRRFTEVGVEEQVRPLRVEAHELPFAHGYFDAVLCVDSFNYFGTDDLYLGYLVDFLKPGGQLGSVMAGVTEELQEVPAHLDEIWDWEYYSFHSPRWWTRHWTKTEKVTQVQAEEMPEGWRHWQRWEETVALAGRENWREHGRAFSAALARDAGRTFNLLRLTARTLPPAEAATPPEG